MVFLEFLKNTIGSSLANLDNAPINLAGIHLENVFDSSLGLQTKLINKYSEETVSIVCELLGSLDIIGNPLGLFDNIATGVKDLYIKPAEGFQQGPLEGVIGIGEGLLSFSKNLVVGTFNSVSKITGAVSNGVSAIPMVKCF